jgi:hypothetical protein
MVADGEVEILRRALAGHGAHRHFAREVTEVLVHDHPGADDEQGRGEQGNANREQEAAEQVMLTDGCGLTHAIPVCQVARRGRGILNEL